MVRNTAESMEVDGKSDAKTSHIEGEVIPGHDNESANEDHEHGNDATHSDDGH
jgi:hypothetical protein